MNHYQYLPGFLYEDEANWLYAKLLQEIPWRQVKYYKPERGLVVTPRLTWCCGFHTSNKYPIYLPDKIFPQDIPEWLLPLKHLVEEKLEVDFNFMLFSYYRDGKDSIAFHSDDEKFLGSNPTIASITVGASRPFLLKEKSSKKTESFDLSNGDLFVMQNDCQQNYMHSVPKIDTTLPRLSITFRKALSETGSKNYYKYNYLSNIL